MKTRDRILETSLVLFNEEGEANVTTVDIANELDISPGNLYYHFKGKEYIIDVLFERFDAQMTEFLTAPMNKSLDIQDNWFYLYVVFEEIFNYRFFYYNLSDILHKYDRISRRFRRLLNMKHTTATSICDGLESAGVIEFTSDAEKEALINSIVMTVIYWVNYNSLKGNLDQGPEVLMHKGVYQVMTLVAPHLPRHEGDFFKECTDLYQELIKQVA